ncbi:hypothetical protein HYDPIDRAFT_113712 [Hydnomerulius pinastri MD-312]|uniref:Uncharacterized protein n=1 Tax=Hydnomerulius pinastri MD-312 TaxID=994086 RepID=A0A0C9VBX5_9AGAM|nr:hypothetical protein HYDPIDRAFT_113712 [Hydnomerulius pinastri MD-312]
MVSCQIVAIHAHPSAKDLLTMMSTFTTPVEIPRVTHISRRNVEHALELWRETGQVGRVAVSRGRERAR